MTGFENTANVAEETIDPYKAFPRSLIGGMIVAGLVYVLVSMAAALTVPIECSPSSDAALLEVVKQGILPFSTDVMTKIFSVIALIAITNTTLVTLVTQPRILYGMAREDVVPGHLRQGPPDAPQPLGRPAVQRTVVGALLVTGYAVTAAGGGIDLVSRLATGDRGLLLAIYALVIVLVPQAARPGRGRTRLPGQHARSSSSASSATSPSSTSPIDDDPALAALVCRAPRRRLVLFLAEYFLGSRGTGSTAPALDKEN